LRWLEEVIDLLVKESCRLAILAAKLVRNVVRQILLPRGSRRLSVKEFLTFAKPKKDSESQGEINE
jgi:hypothetical protein